MLPVREYKDELPDTGEVQAVRERKFIDAADSGA